MKSLTFDRYGSADLLRIAEIEKPLPGPDEILVKIYASSINSYDWELLHASNFAIRAMFGLCKPRKLKTLGIDISGRIEQIGSNVTRFKVGDAVYCDLSESGMGAFAEYVAVPENIPELKPGSLSFEQAATIPQAGLLAWQGLQLARITDNKKVLINGASGGSGTFAIQFCRTFNVEITGVCRGEKMDFVSSLGVDDVIDYQSEDYTRTGKRYDIIIDAQARHPLRDCSRAMLPGGHYIAHGGKTSLMMQLALLGPLISRVGNNNYSLLLHKPNKGLNELLPYFDNDSVIPVIDKTFLLDDVVEALRYYGSGKTKGKIVIKMFDEDNE